MDNILIIATRTQNGGWVANLHNRYVDRDTFNTLYTLSQDMTIIDENNVFDTDVTSGRIVTDFIDSNIENLMRNMGFRKCDECHNWVTPQDVRSGASTYTNHFRRCPACEARLQASRGKKINLQGYHHTANEVRVINASDENFTLSNVKGLGIEMEVNSYNEFRDGNGGIPTTDAFYDIANENSTNRVFRCEYDSTVKAEIISNVFTKKALYAFDWNVLTDQLKKLGNDESIPSVGFHVHFSKLWLGDDEKTQALNFLKLQYFLKSYENDFFKMSGRKRDEMEWCHFYSMSEIEDMRDDVVDFDNPWSYMPTSHGYALIASGSTIELRIGKSTNDPIKITNYLKLVLGIVENLKNVPFEKCYCIGKMTRLVPNDVMAYWRKQGCFLNTNAIDNRGVSL